MEELFMNAVTIIKYILGVIDIIIMLALIIVVLVQYKDEYFCLDYQEALTELQEDYYDRQPYKVKKVEKQITVIDWEAIK